MEAVYRQAPALQAIEGAPGGADLTAAIKANIMEYISVKTNWQPQSFKNISVLLKTRGRRAQLSAVKR